MIKYDIEAQARLDSISLDGIVDGVDYEDSFTSDLILHGNELLILDRANFRLVRYDLEKKQSPPPYLPVVSLLGLQ